MLAKNLETANLGLPIEVVDIDVHTELATDYGIRSVPTLVMLDENIEVIETRHKYPIIKEYR
jgi:thioredoxin-like negative regulator of GroEL